MTTAHEDAVKLQELFRRKRRLERIIAETNNPGRLQRAEVLLARLLPRVSFPRSNKTWSKLDQARFEYRIALVEAALGPDREFVGFPPPFEPNEGEQAYMRRIRHMAAARRPGRPPDHDRQLEILLQVADRMERRGEDQKTAARHVSRERKGKPSAARIEAICSTLRSSMARELAATYGTSLLEIFPDGEDWNQEMLNQIGALRFREPSES